MPARADAAMGSVRARSESEAAAEEAACREAALSYWGEMKALGRPIYAREAPRWVREELETEDSEVEGKEFLGGEDGDRCGVR